MNLTQATQGFGGNLRQGPVPLLDPTAFRGPTLQDIDQAGQSVLNVTNRIMTSGNQLATSKADAELQERLKKRKLEADIKNEAILKDIEDLAVTNEQGKQIAEIAKQKLDAKTAEDDLLISDTAREKKRLQNQEEIQRASEVLETPGVTREARLQAMEGARIARASMADNEQLRKLGVPFVTDLYKKAIAEGGATSIKTADGMIVPFYIDGQDGKLKTGTPKQESKGTGRRQLIKAQIPGMPPGTMGQQDVATGEFITTSDGNPSIVQTPKQSKNMAEMQAAVENFDVNGYKEKINQINKVIIAYDEDPNITSSDTFGSILKTPILGEFFKAVAPDVSAGRQTAEGLSAALGINATQQLKGAISNRELELAQQSTFSANLAPAEAQRRLLVWRDIYAKALARQATIKTLMKNGKSFQDAVDEYNAGVDAADQVATGESVAAAEEYFKSIGAPTTGAGATATTATQSAGQEEEVTLQFKPRT